MKTQNHKAKRQFYKHTDEYCISEVLVYVKFRGLQMLYATYQICVPS